MTSETRTRTALYPLTKFQPPPSRHEHVRRSRCFELLDDVPFVPHLLIGAPAGSGKSTLAAQLTARARGRTAWVSLEPSDDEPGQFWGAVVTAVANACDGLCADLVGGLIGDGDIDTTLVALVNGLAAFHDPLMLVLDDLHRITLGEILDRVRWLLEHLPPHVRAVICSRVDPEIAIARLRAQGRLRTLHAAELRFDEPETAAYLNDSLGLGLSSDELHEITLRTDGWAAGIYLVALSLRAGAPPRQLLAGLGSDQTMREYMASEVLDALDADVGEFLNQICHLDRFCGDLCDVVADRTGSTELLRELDRTNMFVIPLDATWEWHRLQNLFAAVLRERITAVDPDGVKARHRRAAAWFAMHGEPAEAINHYLAAGDHEQAAGIIGARYIVYVNLSRRGATVARWLEALPQATVDGDAALCVASAWVAALRSQRSRRDEYLERATAFGRELRLPDGSTVGSEAALIRAGFPDGDLRQGLEWAREAVRLGSAASALRPLELVVLAARELFVNGPTDEALGASLAAIEAGSDSTTDIAHCAAWSIAAAIHAERGDHETADRAVLTAVNGAHRIGLERVPVSSHIWSLAGYADVLGGRLASASRSAEIAHELGRDTGVRRDLALHSLLSCIVLAMVRVAQGRRGEARVLLGHARERLAHARDAGRMVEMTADLERQLGITGRPATGAGGELSERELELLRALAGPASLREIAGELFISHNTAKTHTRSVYAKLGVASREAAVERARSSDLIP